MSARRLAAVLRRKFSTALRTAMPPAGIRTPTTDSTGQTPASHPPSGSGLAASRSIPGLLHRSMSSSRRFSAATCRSPATTRVPMEFRPRQPLAIDQGSSSGCDRRKNSRPVCASQPHAGNMQCGRNQERQSNETPRVRPFVFLPVPPAAPPYPPSVPGREMDRSRAQQSGVVPTPCACAARGSNIPTRSGGPTASRSGLASACRRAASRSCADRTAGWGSRPRSRAAPRLGQTASAAPGPVPAWTW